MRRLMFVLVGLVAMGVEVSAQTAYTVRDSCGRVMERVTVQPGGVTVVRDPYGRILRKERPRGTTTVVVDRTGRTVALMDQPVRPQGSVVVRDPCGRMVQRIQRSPCGRRELVVDRSGRVVETRHVLPNGDVLIRGR